MALGVEDKLADEELALLGSVLEFSGKTVSSVMVRSRRQQPLTSRLHSVTSISLPRTVWWTRTCLLRCAKFQSFH